MTSWRTSLNVSATSVIAVVVALPVPGPWTTLLAMSAALMVGTGARGARLLGFATLGGVVGTVLVAMAGIAPWAEGARELVFALGWAGLPWLAGLAWRLRSQVRVHAAEQADQDQRQRLDQERTLRDAERLALAGTLHDDLGHALSLVALNLGRLELDDSLPVAAQRTVEAARQQLTGAVERLGGSVRMLRSGEVSGLTAAEDADLISLVEEFRAAGASVTLTGESRVEGNTTGVVRVVREALTNAAKHAPGSPVDVALEPMSGRHTRVTATSMMDETAARHGSGAGSGLSSLREYLVTLGGSLDVDEEHCLFRLHAVVPPADGPPEASSLLPRKIPVRRRMLLIGTGLATCVVVVLGGLEAFAQAEVRRAVLEPDEFARLVEGMPRGQAVNLLPERELLPTPAAREAGTDCHDYAVTADWLANESGDVYRICFSDDNLSTMDVLADGER